MILEEVLSAVQNLEAHNVLNIPKKTISEVGDALETIEKLGVRVEWIDKTFGEIEKKREHFKLTQQLQG